MSLNANVKKKTIKKVKTRQEQENPAKHHVWNVKCCLNNVNIELQ